MALRNRVAELEGRLAGVSAVSGQPIEPSPSGMDDAGRSPMMKNTPGGVVSEAESQDTNPESAADILATNVFDRQPGADIGYFGMSTPDFRSTSAYVFQAQVPTTLCSAFSPPSSRI